jgi:hypothetical protein
MRSIHARKSSEEEISTRKDFPVTNCPSYCDSLVNQGRKKPEESAWLRFDDSILSLCLFRLCPTRRRQRQSQFSLLKPGICTADFQNGDPVFLRAAEGLTDAFLGAGRRGIQLQAGPVFVWT